MKKAILSLLISLFALTTFAQNDVTKFLGIPVDGTKSEMIRKLKAKGFKSSPYDNEILEGEFNGYQVRIYFATANNKVKRICIHYAEKLNRTSIISRFNELLKQFDNKKDNYARLNSACEISDSDDDEIAQLIFDSMLKEYGYQAIYAQRPDAEIDKIIKQRLSYKYSAEELSKPDLNIGFEILSEKLSYASEENKIVWFRIVEDGHKKYSLLLYYDNEYNRANGEDL